MEKIYCVVFGLANFSTKKDCYRDTEEDMLFRKRLEELAKQDKKKTKKKSKDEHIKKKNKKKKKTKKGNIE